MNKNIVIKGAREHNLKNIDLTIPRDKLIVFTGLSGSGKSSLALILSMPKGSAGMLSRCHHMQGSFSAKWKSLM
jgi:excinuclease UvrABC ATPase subunit